MGIIEQLSSQLDDRTEESNRRAALRCLAEPDLLQEVALGLQSPAAALAGDCAEVLTKVAEQRPDLVAPYGPRLPALLRHKNTRVRWEVMHAIALIAAVAPAVVAGLLPHLGELIRSDRSTIVRDYAVVALGNYAATGREGALACLPMLVEAAYLWEGKQAGRALNGLVGVALAAPAAKPQLRALAAEFADHSRGVVRKAALALTRAAAE